jgi:hypothetical protein
MTSLWTANTEGLFLDLPASDYFTAPGFSHSMSQHMDPPAKLPVYLSTPREPKAHQIIGTLTHSKILEPSKPLPQIIVPPAQYPAPADSSLVKSKKVSIGDLIDWNGNAKYCKRWYVEELKLGKLVLTQKEFDMVMGIVESVAKDEDAQSAFLAGQSEVAIFQNFNLGGTVLRKARLDWVPDNSPALVDVKTTLDASPGGFPKQIMDNGYLTQAVWYLDIWNDAMPNDRREFFVFIAVEKEPPYLVCCHKVHIGCAEMQQARAINTARIQRYMACVESKTWPGYPKGFPKVEFPKWAEGGLKRDLEAA